jgi:hypothetical protein
MGPLDFAASARPRTRERGAGSSQKMCSLSLWERAGVRGHFRALHTCPA